MANRDIRDSASGIVKLTEGLDGATPIITATLDVANAVEATSIAQDDFIVAFVDDLPKIISTANLLASKTYIRSFLTKIGGELTEATGATNWQITQRRIAGVSGMTNTVVGVAIVGCDGMMGSTGTTQAKISNADYANQSITGAASATVSVAYNAAYSSQTICSIAALGTPPYFYLFLPTAPTGGHEGLWVQVDVEVSPLS